MDDESAVLDVAKIYLGRDPDLDCTFVTSVTEALLILEKKNYDIIVSDYGMPDKNGIEFLKIIRSHDTGTPFILVTGRGTEEVVIDALNNGADFYVQKEGDPNTVFADLIAKIKIAVRYRRAVDKIFKSEERYRTLFESANDAIIILNGELECLDKNKKAEELFGFVKGIFDMANCFSLIFKNPEDFKGSEEEYRTYFLEKYFMPVISGQPLRFEYMLTRFNGERFEADLSLSPLISDGKTLVLAIIRDISKQKDAKRRLITAVENTNQALLEAKRSREDLFWQKNMLMEKERFLKTLLSNLPGMVYQCKNDPGWTMIFVSEGCRDLTGYEPEDLINNSLLSYGDVISPEYREKVWELWQKRIMKNEMYDDEYEIITKKGEKKWVWERGRPVYDIKGEVVALEGFIADTSEKKKIEDELKEATGHLKATLYAIPDILLEIDNTGKIIDVNSKSSHVFHREKYDLTGKNLAEIMPAGVAGPLTEKIRDVINTGEMGKLQFYIPFSTGFEWFELSIARHELITGKKPVAIGIVRDITEYIRSEESLKLANKKLNLLSSVTRHDVLNQITAAQGFLELISFSPHDEKETAIINKLMSIISVITKQIRFTGNYQDIGLNAPVWQNLHELMSLSKDGIEIPEHVQIEDKTADIEILADPMISRVFINFIDNTIRHGKNADRIIISSKKENNDCILIYEDNGAGVSIMEKERIFSRGYGMNTGFGLFLSREILEITNYTIVENGTFGQGARFEIKIPAGYWKYKLS
ncbi:PAS domain S-box protein [Methanochimaera problematica]|uniref:PAS domain S-box protein n=1 Tax=Methanochimaera problematica TaxID=2609417 RepID=UPI002938DBA0|nr:PAS domain S-box protein [Methanoplanus sp. FWC-SCC4]